VGRYCLRVTYESDDCIVIRWRREDPMSFRSRACEDSGLDPPRSCHALQSPTPFLGGICDVDRFSCLPSMKWLGPNSSDTSPLVVIAWTVDVESLDPVLVLAETLGTNRHNLD
jgi:hypothetical protein